jgi:hypothetical protein
VPAFVAIFCFAICSPTCALADEPAKTDTKEDQQIAKKYKARAKADKLSQDIDRSLERYEVFEGDNETPLTVKQVLIWNNPVAGGFGKFRTVLYIHDGQPKAVCCIWPGSGNRLYHEFGSLTRNNLRGKFEGKRSWSMADGVVGFVPIPDADPPAADRRRRFLQMKSLIRRFSAIETLSRKGEPTREVLRMLPTPLFRYEKESEQIVDGAVFAFVHATDPEALVVLEAVKKDDAMKWEYTFVRRTTLPVTGELDEIPVWSTDVAGYKSFNQIGSPR